MQFDTVSVVSKRGFVGNWDMSLFTLRGVLGWQQKSLLCHIPRSQRGQSPRMVWSQGFVLEVLGIKVSPLGFRGLLLLRMESVRLVSSCLFLIGVQGIVFSVQCSVVFGSPYLVIVGFVICDDSTGDLGWKTRPACSPRTPKDKVTSESSAKVTASQGIDPMDTAGRDFGWNQFLGLFEPQSLHLGSSQILESELKILEVRVRLFGGGGGFRVQLAMYSDCTMMMMNWIPASTDYVGAGT